VISAIVSVSSEAEIEILEPALRCSDRGPSSASASRHMEKAAATLRKLAFLV
jgi:hypothetical protein